jgi:hypothetical protein
LREAILELHAKVVADPFLNKLPSAKKPQSHFTLRMMLLRSGIYSQV